MDKLQIINHNGQFVTDSRDVAEMVGKRHSDLLESIRTYMNHLTNGNFRLSDFFIPSGYKDEKGENRPCCLLTRKGCDMVANKMTGEKGVLFTAAYVTKFEEMEKQQAIDTSQLSPQTQLILQLSQAIAKAEIEASATKQIALEAKSGLEQARETINTIKDTVAALPKDQWREWVSKSMNEIVKVNGFRHDEIRNESYRLLEERAGANLGERVRRAKIRLEDTGATKTVVNNYCKLDAIEAEKRLKEIYTGIIKEMRVKYLV